MNDVFEDNDTKVLNMTGRAAQHRRREELIRRRTFNGKDYTMKFTVDRGVQVGCSRRLLENEYMRRKTTVQGLLVIALLTTTASNLRELLHTQNPPKFYSIIFILTCMSLAFQAIAGILILTIAICERTIQQDLVVIRNMNDVIIFFAFVVLLICIFLSSLGPSYAAGDSSQQFKSNVVIH